MKATNLLSPNSMQRRISILRMALILSLILVSIFALGVFSSRAASAESTVSNYPMQSSLQWTFVQGTTPANSYFEITVAAFGSNPSLIPSQVYVSFWITYNGMLYYNHACLLNYNSGQTSASCSFNAPFIGNGDYTFYATFFNSAGHVVAQNITDPRIDPDWH